MAEQAHQNIGKHAIQLLLVDRGFLDGGRLWTLKHKMHIDFVIPAKTDMQVTRDIRGMRNLPECDFLQRQKWQTEKGKVCAIGVRPSRSSSRWW